VIELKRVRAMKTYAAIVKAPEFSIGIECNADEITGIDYLEPLRRAGAEIAAGAGSRAPVARLAEGFALRVRPAVAPAGTHFQRRVWTRITAIPSGQTMSYGEVAADPQRPARGGQCLRRQSLSHRRALPSRGRRQPGLGGFARTPAASCSTSRSGCCATNMPVSDASLIDEFIDALWLADGLSKNTLGAYRSDLALFAAWLGAQGKSIVGADGTAINAYLAHLHARPGGIKATSQRRLMASLRRCYRWLLDQGRLAADPLLNIDKPRQAQRFPKTLSESRSRTCSMRPTSTRRWACATAPCWNCCMPPACACRSWSASACSSSASTTTWCA
jgi:hypothetical protein